MINIKKLHSCDSHFFKQLILDEDAYFEDFKNLGWSEDQINSQLESKINLSYGIFDHGLLIAFLLGNLIFIEKESEYEILLIYVCKKFRKRGIGTKLLKEVEKNKTKNYLKKIYLEVSKKNNEGISFYNRMNFKKLHTRKNYYKISNTNIDADILFKNII